MSLSNRYMRIGLLLVLMGLLVVACEEQPGAEELIEIEEAPTAVEEGAVAGEEAAPEGEEAPAEEAAPESEAPAEEAEEAEAEAEEVEEAAPTEEVTEEAAAEGEATEDPAAEEEAPSAGEPAEGWETVADQAWVLVAYGDALNPVVVEEGLVITATFSSAEGQVSGSGGCNNFFAGYEAGDDGALMIEGPIGSTMMACAEGMETETAYFAALETASGWALTEEGRLELTVDTGAVYEEKLIYQAGAVPLTGTTWRLVSFGDPEDLSELIEGTAITITFAAESETSGTASGSATCNNYTAEYTLDGENISFGPLAGTMMMCPEVQEQEDAYLAALQTAQTIQIMGANMQIVTEEGVLNFTSLEMPLENVLWRAQLVAGEPLPEGAEITALFTPGETAGEGIVGGSAGCNNYNTTYEWETDESSDPPTNLISISELMAMTQMMCPEEAVAEVEERYLAALAGAESFTIEGEQLLLQTAEGEVLFTADREPLLGTLWTLVSWGMVDNQAAPPEGSNFTATFSQQPTLPTGTVSGETGCNDYSAAFTADLTTLKVNLPQKTNNEDCPWGEGNFEVEQQFFLGLNGATRYRIVGDRLQIPYGEGEDMQALIFEAAEPEEEDEEEEEEALDLSPLDNTFWHLARLGDTPILSGSQVTAGFAIDDDGVTGKISGVGSCNAYNADIGENFAIGPIATTRKVCAQPLMTQESIYLDWLASASAFERTGDELLITTAEGVLTFQSDAVLDQAYQLQNRTWYMISYGSLTAIPGSNPTALFSPDGRTVSGTTGCNDYNGAYNAGQGNTLAISDIAMTRAACASDALTKQEETFLRLLPAATNYSVSGQQMQILTVDGQTINFSAVAPEAPQGPEAAIDGPAEAETGEQLAFDGSASTAGDTPIAGYSWDMGDGTRLSGPTVAYTYDAPGTYTVSLVVTDRTGQSSTATQAVQVTAAAEVVPPTAVIEGPATAFVGEPVTFSAANSQQGTAAITQYQWQSGDGNDSGPVAENTFTTIYAQPGTYYPSVLVADAGGLSDSASLAIRIDATLEGSSWILDNTAAGTSITLTFGNGTLSGFAGCNNYNAGFSSTRAAGSTNSISVGPIASTEKLCPEEIMSQEQGYLARLQTASSYTISGSTLTLTTAEGPLTYSAAVATPYVGP